MSLPARRTRRAVVQTGAATGAAVVIAAVFGVVGWVADLIVDTDGRTVRELVHEITTASPQ